MKRIVRALLRDQHGASVVEYAVLVSILSIAAVATIFVIGQDIDDKFAELVRLVDEHKSGS